eukprot:5293012-Prymnesium_polylepis.1
MGTVAPCGRALRCGMVHDRCAPSTPRSSLLLSARGGDSRTLTATWPEAVLRAYSKHAGPRLAGVLPFRVGAVRRLEALG